MYLDFSARIFSPAKIFEKNVRFSNERIDRNTVPKGLYVYEVRHDGQKGIPVEIGDIIIADFLGTIISPEKIALPDGYRKIREGDWIYV